MMLTGDNGILQRAAEAKENTEQSQLEEQRRLASMAAATNLTETEFQGVKIPVGFAPTMIEGESTKEEGLVITDSTGNEFVWIEVPNKTKDPTATFGPDYEAQGVTSKYDYVNIEKAIYRYYTTSNVSRQDNWYDSSAKNKDNSNNLNDRNGCGLTAEEYEQLYEECLTNIYENQGFWLGRYGAGTENGYRHFDNRNEECKKEHPAVEKPVTKKNAYPYGWVTCAQAQKLSSETYSGNRKSGLMFWIQFMCLYKYLQNCGDWGSNDETVILNYLDNDGASWGNYYDSLYSITDDRAHYSLDFGETWLNGKYEKKEDAAILLSTRSI